MNQLYLHLYVYDDVHPLDGASHLDKRAVIGDFDTRQQPTAEPKQDDDIVLSFL